MSNSGCAVCRIYIWYNCHVRVHMHKVDVKVQRSAMPLSSQVYASLQVQKGKQWTQTRESKLDSAVEENARGIFSLLKLLNKENCDYQDEELELELDVPLGLLSSRRRPCSKEDNSCHQKTEWSAFDNSACFTTEIGFEAPEEREACLQQLSRLQQQRLASKRGGDTFNNSAAFSNRDWLLRLLK